jgi:hypothetical protein
MSVFQPLQCSKCHFPRNAVGKIKLRTHCSRFEPPAQVFSESSLVTLTSQSGNQTLQANVIMCSLRPIGRALLSTNDAVTSSAIHRIRSVCGTLPPPSCQILSLGWCSYSNALFHSCRDFCSQVCSMFGNDAVALEAGFLIDLLNQRLEVCGCVCFTTFTVSSTL